MSEEIVEDSFGDAAENVEKAHQQAVDSLRKNVADAKAEALRKIKS